MIEFQRERIAERRKLLGFSQADVAGKIGISKSAYNRMELGKQKIDVELLPRFADALLCKVKFFYT